MPIHQAGDRAAIGKLADRRSACRLHGEQQSALAEHVICIRKFDVLVIAVEESCTVTGTGFHYYRDAQFL